MATDLGEKLRTLRRAADLSQRELARRAGVPKSTVTRLEAGTITNPAFRTIEQLVDAAGGSLAINAAAPLEPRPQLAELIREAARDREQRGERQVPHQDLRDSVGRRYPAHLDARATYPMFGRDGMPLRAGTPVVTFELNRGVRDDRRVREAPADAARIEHRELSEGAAWEWTARADTRVVGWLGAHMWPEIVGHVRSRSERRVVLCRMELRDDWTTTGLGRRLVGALRQWRDERGDVDVYSFGLGYQDLSLLRDSGFHPSTEYAPRMLKLSAH